MPRKHSRQPEQIAGDSHDPQGMHVLLRAYLEYLQVHNYSAGTRKKRRCHLNHFIRWSAERSLTRPSEITRAALERYQRSLFHATDRKGKRLSFFNQHSRLSSVRGWFKWLTRQRHLEVNPASELELPKLGHRLPKHVLNQVEVEDILNLPDVNTTFGIRDRAMLETFYSTGIRRLELINLQVYDVDVERGVLTVRQGKGQKDRTVPIGDRALAWTEKYRHDARPRLLVNDTETSLYLTRYGESFSPTSLSQLVCRYVNDGETEKTGSCHLFRHTMATAMHDNGADIRYIQAMLGHAKLDTTQIYTQVSIRKLKEVHEATHPANNKGKKKTEDDKTDSSDAA